MGKFRVEKILNGKLLEYCYFGHDESSKTGFCIDPGYDIESIMKVLNKNEYIVDSILLTHAHFDHMLSCVDIIKKYNSKVYMSKEDEEILYSAEHNYSNLINKTEFEKFDIYKFVNDNEEIVVCDRKIRCISTPGHTKGGISYYLENEKTLFSGDTLFYETYGRTDLYGGSYHDMKVSIVNKLFTLPNDTIVYPGHGESTTISHEQIHNEIRREGYEF